MRPYIGITGVTDAREMDTVCEQFEQNLQAGTIPHVGMAGVLCSGETLKGNRPNPRYVPDVRILKETMTAARGVLPMLHVEIDKHPQNQTPFAQNVDALLDYAGRDGVAVQLNGFPHADEIENLRNERPGLLIVLQVRKELLQMGIPAIR